MNKVSSQPSVAEYSANHVARVSNPTEAIAVLPGALPSESGVELEYPAFGVSLGRLGHVPFLFWIVDALSPRTIVELGDDSGDSYCALLQAASHLALDVRCYGIDEWALSQGDEAYRELCSHHDPRYGAFSTLLRCSYDAAVGHFADGSIDLLHIDGACGHDAILLDFKTWLPRMSSRGVVMVRNTNARRGEQGAELFRDLQSRYPTFEFLHADGLGIAYVGDEPLSDPLKALLDRASRFKPLQLRTYFARLGTSVQDRVALHSAEERIALAQAQRDEIRRQMETTLAAKDNARAGRNANTLNLRQQMAVVTRLQREVAVLNRHKLEWEQILQSTSWRVTAPLRWVVIRLRSLLTKLPG